MRPAGMKAPQKIRLQREQRLDQLARRFAETHDPVIRGEIGEISHLLAKLRVASRSFVEIGWVYKMKSVGNSPFT
jgi:hypothetical protein